MVTAVLERARETGIVAIDLEIDAGHSRAESLYRRYDRVSGTVDLSEAVGKGVFAVWRDPLVFERVRIGSSGELVWGEQVDLCPDALYLKVTCKKPEDIFPALRNQSTHA